MSPLRPLSPHFPLFQACSSWLQAGAVALTANDAELHDRECHTLASILGQEHNEQISLHAIGVLMQLGSIEHLQALLELVASCLHLSDAASQFTRGSGKLHLCVEAMNWAIDHLHRPPSWGPPSSAQLAVAFALLRAQALQGCSRQLASLADAFAAATTAQGDSGQPSASAVAAANAAAVLAEYLHKTEDLLTALLSTRWPPQAFDQEPTQSCAPSSASASHDGDKLHGAPGDEEGARERGGAAQLQGNERAGRGNEQQQGTRGVGTGEAEVTVQMVEQEPPPSAPAVCWSRRLGPCCCWRAGCSSRRTTGTRHREGARPRHSGGGKDSYGSSSRGSSNRRRHTAWCYRCCRR